MSGRCGGRGGLALLVVAAAVLTAAFVAAFSCTPRPPAGRPTDEWTTWTGKKEPRPAPAPKPAEKERARGRSRRFDAGRPLGPLRVALRIDALALEVTLPRGGRIAWEGGEIPIGEGGSVRFAPSEGAVELRGPTEPRLLPSPVNVLPDGAEPWLLERKPYAGTLSLVAGKGGLAAVNGIGLEDYLRGVVPWEIGWLPVERVEALKAQAIAARTYALSRVAVAEEGSLWDLVATESDQVYRGLERTDPVVDRAIDETAGLVAVHDDELIRAYYSSTCGGRTAPVPDVWIDREPAPYLRAVRDAPGGSDSPARAYCRASPHFRWQERWKGEEIGAILRNLAAEKGIDPAALGRLRDVRVEETGETGRALRTVFETERSDLLVEADRIRWVLRRPGGAGILRSAWITLDVKRSRGFVAEIVAEGRGHGHGVGMCQWGAIGMADEGIRCEEILRHYYKGVRLEEAGRALAGGAG